MTSATDYLIVGGGLAGTVLAHTLLQKGCQVLVVNGSPPASSAVAAGIYNPVTGQRLVKTWEADLLFPFLERFYSDLEKLLQTRLLYPCPLYRPFASVTEQNQWTARTADPDGQAYLWIPETSPYPAEVIHHPLGGIQTLQAGFVDVPALTRASQQWLKAQGLLLETDFDYSHLKINPDSIEWQGIRAQKILFCEGIHALRNPYFNWLPFKPVKGEILDLHTEINFEGIVNQGIFVMPAPQGGLRVGATYNWQDSTWETTPEARTELTGKLAGLLRVPYQIAGQRAGIRPATNDRRPFVGLHPKHPEVGIFNGLGSKGVSLAPYFAAQFADFLMAGKELHPEVRPERNISLYSG